MRAHVLVASLISLTSYAGADPIRVSPGERRELDALARRFFESTRDGARAPTQVFPSRAELTTLFTRSEPIPGPMRAPPARPNEGVVLRQLAAIDRDVAALRPRFRGGVYVGLTGPLGRDNTLRARGCGRYARTDAVCADGLILEYRVGSELRRFNLDTLLRVGGHWRVLDVRH